MDIQLATERLFLLDERATADEIQQRAMDKRTQAFGAGIGSLLQRIKPEEVTLIGRQRRLEPMWHVACSARYVYERKRDYSVVRSAPEVVRVTIEGTDYDVIQQPDNSHAFKLSALEHCREEYHRDVYVDGLTGASMAHAQSLLAGPKTEIADPATLSEDGTITLAPQHRASFVVRELLSEMLKPVQADKILEETIALETTDLYYRPIWSFEFSWAAKDKRALLDVDSLTGETRPGTAGAARAGVKLTRDLIFDIGADTAGMFIPGGSIAVKLAKAAIDSQRHADKSS